MTDRIKQGLIRLRPRNDTIYVSQNRTVLSMARDGFIHDGVEHGLIVYETRLLSRYQYRIDGKEPLPVALSNVEQHTWLGYYLLLPKELHGEIDQGIGMLEEMTQHSLELKIARYVADGIHEDVDLTNYTQRPIWFELQLNILSTPGFRTQGVAYKQVKNIKITQDDESKMTFLGIISFYDTNAKLWE